MVKTGRTFGNFLEKKLVCDLKTRGVIQKSCDDSPYAWENNRTDGLEVMTKIPAIVLVKLMQGVTDDVAASLVGAYSDSTNPEQHTCMNVIVGRHPVGDVSYAVDKFSLYYEIKNAQEYPLLDGYSFRTACLKSEFRDAGLTQFKSDNDLMQTYKLSIDNTSQDEHWAYMKIEEGEEDADFMNRIDNMITHMLNTHLDKLALSDDPIESTGGVTALQSEWILFQNSVTRQAVE